MTLWVGTVKFSSWKEANLYVKLLRKYHYIAQDGKCCYCEKQCYYENTTKRMREKDATLEHLQEVSMTKKLKNIEGCLSKGNLSFDNTRMACHKCNSSRPSGMSWLEYKSMVMDREELKCESI